MPNYSLKDVFGIRAHQVVSYTERGTVDGRFEVALEGDHHIVVYGSSKQGKTSLRLKHLDDGKCVVVRCGPKMGVEDLYMSILRQEGVTIDVYDTRTVSGKFGTKVQLAYKARLPFFAGTASGELSGEGEAERERRSNYVAFNLGEAQSVSEILRGMRFSKFVVLENSHYLCREVQQEIARDLKTFHEVGIRFIILGIWRESNMLMIHNPDLQDRVTEIPVEPWHKDDFDRVISVGCECLNVNILRDILGRFKHEAFGNIGMLQEFLRLYCEVHGVMQTQEKRLSLVSNDRATEVFQQKLSDQKNQLVRCLEVIAAKSRTDHRDPLLLPYYLVRVLCKVSIEELQEGIPKQRLLEYIRDMHHRENKETIRSGDITYLLKSLQQLQVDLGTPFLYYDANTRRVRLVDTRHFFVLNRANRDDILEEIPNPADEWARQMGLSSVSSTGRGLDECDDVDEGRNVFGGMAPASVVRGGVVDSGEPFDEDWNRPTELVDTDLVGEDE